MAIVEKVETDKFAVYIRKDRYMRPHLVVYKIL